MLFQIRINNRRYMTVNYHEPPDGGWGWMVVFGVALINLVNQPLFSVFSLIFGDTLKEMSDGKTTGLTLVMSIHVCMGQFSGLLIKPLIKKISIKYITILSVVSTSAGLISSSFATKLWQIVISFGICGGMGLGLLMATTFLAINEYFTTKKSIAVGISMAGTSIGQMVMPLLVGVLLKNYGFSGTTLTLGCLSLIGVIGAVLFEPLCKRKEKDEMLKEVGIEKRQYSLSDKTHLATEQREILLINDVKHDDVDNKDFPKNAPSIENSDESKSNPKGFIKSLIHDLDLHLLKQYTFVSLFVGLSIGYLSSISFSTFFPLYLKIDADFNMLQTTTCMTALSAADILGRLTSPPIFKKLNFSCRMQFIVGCALLALFRFCLTATSNYHFMLIFSFFTGYFRAITVINQNLVVSEAVSKPELPSAVGINMVLKGITIMAMGQPLGLIKDAFDYDLCINILNAILVVVVVWWSTDIIIQKKRKNKILKEEDIQLSK